jgi:flagellar biosynthesis component FlhA
MLCSLTGTSETVDAREMKEMRDFLDAVMDTKPIQYCHAYLAAKVRASMKNQIRAALEDT